MPMADQEIETFLSETQVAVISTVDAKNHPRSAPIWYAWEDGAAYLFTGRLTLKWRNIQRNPHVSLCLDWREPPYRSAIIEGLAEEVDRQLYECCPCPSDTTERRRAELSPRAIGTIQMTW